MLPSELEKNFKPDRANAAECLKDDDASAFACLVAAMALLQPEDGDEPNPLFDDEDDGQPLDPGALRILLEDAVPGHDGDCRGKVTGLLMAVSGDDFFEDPVHFERMVSAIIHGDPFRYEDDDDYPSAAEMVWAVYQVGLMIDEPLDELFQDRVKRFMSDVFDEEAEDKEALLEGLDPEFEDPEEEYYERFVTLRRALLAKELLALGVDADWLADLDPRLTDFLPRD